MLGPDSFHSSTTTLCEPSHEGGVWRQLDMWVGTRRHDLRYRRSDEWKGSGKGRLCHISLGSQLESQIASPSLRPAGLVVATPPWNFDRCESAHLVLVFSIHGILLLYHSTMVQCNILGQACRDLGRGSAGNLGHAPLLSTDKADIIISDGQASGKTSFVNVLGSGQVRPFALYVR